MSSTPQLDSVLLQNISGSHSATTLPDHVNKSNSEENVPPAEAVSVSQRWNQSKTNMYKTFSTFLGFLVMGANDAAYGALIHYIGIYYKISYTIVSLIFLSPFVGYIAAAAMSNFLHKKIGQRGVAILGPSCHLLAYTAIALHPPYPALVIVFIFAGFGNGVLDSAWNAWVGNLANPNEILGLLHGFYGLGATVAPLIATTFVARQGLPWYTFYYVMVGRTIRQKTQK